MLALLGLGSYAWTRMHPQPLPYWMRIFVLRPRPFLSPKRLVKLLDPAGLERVLEVGPGTGSYTLPVARALAPGARLEIFDVQQSMIDHTLRAAAAAGLTNVTGTCGTAERLPYGDESFDAAFAITVLGEIREAETALCELRRVVKQGAPLVVGEWAGDPDWLTLATICRRAEGAGWRLERRDGNRLSYFARFRPA